MRDVSMLRVHVLRATYLLLVVGLGLTIWPSILSHPPGWPLFNGVTSALLGAISVMALLGLRYPLQMLPLLLFEFAWKAIWLLAVALPLWTSGQMDARTLSTVYECLFGVILMPLVIPWPYVWATYVRKAGDPWTRRPAAP